METVLLLACLLDSNNLVDSYLWVLVHHPDSTFLQAKDLVTVTTPEIGSIAKKGDFEIKEK